MSKFEDALLESGSIMRKGYSTILENSGKLIALLTAAVAILLTFADVGLPSIVGAELGADLLIMLAASYVIYFSLEDAGERLGKTTDIYTSAEKIWRNLSHRVGGDAVGRLRSFCISYSKEELKYRKEVSLIAAGLTADELAAYEAGEVFPRKTRRILSRISRMKPIEISPTVLLGAAGSSSSSELKNPERGKVPRLILSLLPTTLCMLFTVSMMISAKSGLDAGAIISGIVKLSTLPMIAMKGYSCGYEYAKGTLPLWMGTKSKLLEAFLEEGDGNH